MRARWSGPGVRVLLLGLALTTVAIPSLVLAQSTEQRQTPPSRTGADDPARLDLAAMTLTIEDLAAAGLEGYGIGSGQERSLATTAEVLAENRGGITPENLDRFTEFLDEVGWQRGYESGLAVLQEDDPSFFAQVVSSTLDVYLTEADANDAFTRLSNPEDVTIAEVEVVPESDTRLIGDDSAVWLVEGEAEDTGEPFQAVLVSFRVGNIEAGVGIYNWDEQAPDIALAQELADRLLARIDTGGDAVTPAATPEAMPLVAPADTDRPPLSTTALTFGAVDIDSYYHNYLLHDGTVIPFAGEELEQLVERSLAYRNAVEVYTVNQVFPSGAEGGADDGYYALWRYRFEDAAAAADWFEIESKRFIGNVTELPIGDQAFLYSYVLPVSPEQTARGYVGYLLVGSEVAIIDSRAVPETPLVSYAEMLRLQADCIASAAPCPLAAIPYHLRQYLTPEGEDGAAGDEAAPGATPVASPEASPIASPGATPVASPEVIPMATPVAGDEESQ